MFGIDLESIKKKASEAIDTSATFLSETIEKAKDIGADMSVEVIEATQQISEKISNTVRKSEIQTNAKEKIMAVLTTTENMYTDIKENIKKPQVNMKHKVLMMGGRRAGKSTILSSILSQLCDNTPGTICTIIDRTDYTQEIETPSGRIPLPTLAIKQNEIKQYLKKKQKNTEFLVDMSPNYGQVSYILEVSANNSAIDFEFIDVPGEWMRANVADHAQLRKFVEESDVFVIAIDTPFLMDTDNDEGVSVNLVYNRIKEITQAMATMKINAPTDLKQIILCPVKCEKWVQNGKAEEVVQKVLKSYRDLINRWVSCPEVTIQIMPIQTVGGFEASRMLPAKLYFKDDNDPTGTSCSVDPLTGIIIDKNGKSLRPIEGSFIQDDPFWVIDYIDIPLSWYMLNDKGYAPKYCEQPGFHILKFLVEKEENAIREKAEAERKKLNDANPFVKWVRRIFTPTFGQYLPIWKGVITQLSNGNHIKTDGDGFCYVRSKVE